MNIYNNEGLVDSKSIEYNPSLIDAADIAVAASPAVVGENVDEILLTGTTISMLVRYFTKTMSKLSV